MFSGPAQGNASVDKGSRSPEVISGGELKPAVPGKAAPADFALPRAPVGAVTTIEHETARQLGVSKKDLFAIVARIELARELLVDPQGPEDKLKKSPVEDKLTAHAVKQIREHPLTAPIVGLEKDLSDLMANRHALTQKSDPERETNTTATIDRLTHFRSVMRGMITEAARNPGEPLLVPVPIMADGANAASELANLLKYSGTQEKQKN